jgi:hypothetical protein
LSAKNSTAIKQKTETVELFEFFISLSLVDQATAFSSSSFPGKGLEDGSHKWTRKGRGKLLKKQLLVLAGLACPSLR